MQLNPYLNFNGKCELAFKFYEKALGGKIISMMPFEGTPMAAQLPPEMHKQIIHARLAVGDKLLMGSDAPPDRYEGNHGFAVSIMVTTPEEAERIFKALSENARIDMPMQQTFWSPRFGMLVDQFGIPWMVNCETAS